MTLQLSLAVAYHPQALLHNPSPLEIFFSIWSPLPGSPLLAKPYSPLKIHLRSHGFPVAPKTIPRFLRPQGLWVRPPTAIKLFTLIFWSQRCCRLLGGKDGPRFASDPAEMIAVWHPWQLLDNHRLSVWVRAASYWVSLHDMCKPGAGNWVKWHRFFSFQCRLLFKLLSVQLFLFCIWYFFFNISVHHLEFDPKKSIKMCVFEMEERKRQRWLMPSIYSIFNLEKTVPFRKVA